MLEYRATAALHRGTLGRRSALHGRPRPARHRHLASCPRRRKPPSRAAPGRLPALPQTL